MRKALYVLSICLLLPAFAKADDGDEKKESFYEQISRAVIRLEHVGQTKQEGSDDIQCRTVSDGTGFFVAGGKHLYVVSARHVVEKDHDLHARVGIKNDKTGEIEGFHLKLSKERWIFHTDNGDEDTRYVDVAAQKISVIKDRTIKYFRYESKDSKDSEKNQLPVEDADLPQSILVFGFPEHIGFELLEQRPFARQGIISMKTGKEFIKLDGKFVERKCDLIDVKIFPGNSGSPVMNEMNILARAPRLLGVVIATNNKMDFAVMEPVSRIREVLDLAKEQSTEGINFWSLISD